MRKLVLHNMFDTWTIKRIGTISKQGSDLVLPLELEDSYGNLHSYELHQSCGGHLSLWKGLSLVDVNSPEDIDIYSLTIGSTLEVSLSIPNTELNR